MFCHLDISPTHWTFRPGLWAFRPCLLFYVFVVFLYGPRWPFSEIDFKEVVAYSLEVRSDDSEHLAVWRTIVLNRARRGVASSQTNVLPYNSEEDHSSSLDVCSRQGSLQGGNL